MRNWETILRLVLLVKMAAGGGVMRGKARVSPGDTEGIKCLRSMQMEVPTREHTVWVSEKYIKVWTVI